MSRLQLSALKFQLRSFSLGYLGIALPFRRDFPPLDAAYAKRASAAIHLHSKDVFPGRRQAHGASTARSFSQRLQTQVFSRECSSAVFRLSFASRSQAAQLSAIALDMTCL
jgi:hypothetical protein